LSSSFRVETERITRPFTKRCGASTPKAAENGITISSAIKITCSTLEDRQKIFFFHKSRQKDTPTKALEVMLNRVSMTLTMYAPGVNSKKVIKETLKFMMLDKNDLL
jgi:hypothetical protein